MINDVIFKLKQNALLYEYLKYHSYWYQVIVDDESKVKDMILEMKKELKNTPEDKLKDLSENLEKVSMLINLFI